MCEKPDHKVEKHNDWILFVFSGSLYGRMTVHESWKCVKMNRILKCERLLFLPLMPGIRSLFGFPPCHASRVTGLRGGLGHSGYRHKLFGLMHRVIRVCGFFSSLNITGF